MTASILVTSPYRPFTLPDKFSAVFNGYIYCGLVDKDPTVPANQVQIYLVNEDGSQVPVPQPLRTNAGGFLVYNGKPAKFVTDSNHSLLVQGSNKSQIWYEPNIGNIDPEKLSEILRIKYSQPADGEYAFIPYSYIVNFSSTPDIENAGPGGVSFNGVTCIGDSLRFNPAKTTIFYCPDDYARKATGINYPPPFVSGFDRPSMSHVISAGSNLDDETRSVRRNVAFGPLIGSDPIDWNLIDAFGSNPMAYAGRVERNTAIGSEVMVWFGAPSQDWVRKYQHDWWRKPASNPYEPGEPGWNADGIETIFPGIGGRIASFTGYATTTSGAGYCCGFGRDALNRIVTGERNTAAGYGAAQNLFSGSYNTDYGALAGRNGVFSNYCTRIGDQAGMNSNDTNYASFLGYACGREIESSDGVTAVGSFAGAGVKSAKKAVIIGTNAGRDHPSPLDDCLLIANSATQYAEPLISGKFSDAVVGVNISPEKIRATMHVRNASSGSSLSHAGGVLTESPGTAFFVAETSSTGEGQYRFADPESASVGMVAYSHASNSMKLVINGSERVRVEADCLRPTVANSILCGRQAYPWSGGFTQTQFTVTSDERLKTTPVDISDAILDAWSNVEWCQYKFLDRIDAKGDGARWHFGAIAQRIHSIFKDHGLDAFEFGLVCYDKWDEEPEEYRYLTDAELQSGEYPLMQEKIVTRPAQPAGDKWGLVYEEALILEAKLQRRNYERLLARIEALESK